MHTADLFIVLPYHIHLWLTPFPPADSKYKKKIYAPMARRLVMRKKHCNKKRGNPTVVLQENGELECHSSSL